MHPVDLEEAKSLTNNDYVTWLTPDRISDINWHYSQRYFDHLARKNRAQKVIDETQRSSREILGMLGDPCDNQHFFIRGLVNGQVQQGKTENFNAVINGAIDAGYKLIIVLSGIMEDLRSQTQDRIEEDVIGYGSIDLNGRRWARNGNKGVGERRPFGPLGNSDVFQIESITSCETDFKRARITDAVALNSPKIIVCKKNVSVLRNLLIWLYDLVEHERGTTFPIPLLMLDDEADNASLNNEGSKGQEYASKINGHIRSILSMFDRKNYLAYTASPFANVLADRNQAPENAWKIPDGAGGSTRDYQPVDNLFPDDFISRLEAPTNYIGAKLLFETIGENDKKIPLFSTVGEAYLQFPTRVDRISGEPVEDLETQEEWDAKIARNGSYLGCIDYREYKAKTRAAKRDDEFPSQIPGSLEEAVYAFIISNAVRDLRKKELIHSGFFEPNYTMLVHVSRFTNWQTKTARLIENLLSTVCERLDNDHANEKGSIYPRLEAIWNKYFNHIVNNISDYLPDGYDDPFMVPITFRQIIGYLPTAASQIKVLAINSETNDLLSYPKDDPQKIIAIGGNRLSRGFTVKGLSINYFVRKTNYSDSLLQMGRWFGYRPGYLDCCRIFTTNNLIEKFNSTTRCLEELELEFDKMYMHKRVSISKNYLLKVKKHPGALQITRPSILRNAKTLKWSFCGQTRNDNILWGDTRENSAVYETFRSNIAPIFQKGHETRDGMLIKQISAETVLAILDEPNNFDPITLKALRMFIERCQVENKITNWTIAIKVTGRSKRILAKKQTGLPMDAKLAVRNGPSKAYKNSGERQSFLEKKEFRVMGKSANIMSSPRDMAAGLTLDEIAKAEKAYTERPKHSGKSRIPESAYREYLSEQQAVF